MIVDIDPAWLRFFSTGIEILGVFFLSVEAIKLQNVHIFRQIILEPVPLKMNNYWQTTGRYRLTLGR